VNRIEVESFSEIEDEFIKRVNTVVWCNVATVGPDNRPRSRILHPYWEGTTGWITTRPTSFKVKHLAHNPYISLAYITDLAKPVYAECRAEWIDDLDEKQRIWDTLKNTDPPMGFDPGTIYKAVDGGLRLPTSRRNLSSGILRRIRLATEKYRARISAMTEQDAHPPDDPISPFARLTISMFERSEPIGEHAERFGDWFNTPEDMEGVVTRIGSMAAMFGLAILISVTLCTFTYIINMIVGYIHCVNIGVTSCVFGL